MARDEAFDPNDIDSLEHRLAQLRQAPAAGLQPSIGTGGGAHIAGGVKVRNGHFIGHDYINIVATIVQHGEDPQEAQAVVAEYLQSLVNTLAGLPLSAIDGSIDRARQMPLPLADIYVPLNTTTRIPRQATLSQWLARATGGSPEEMEAQRELRPVLALEALGEHRALTVLGKPGSGKSTFGASVLLALAQSWQGHGDELPKLGSTWRSAPLPIRVVLRRFAEWLSQQQSEPPSARNLWAFIGSEVNARAYALACDPMKYLQRMVAKHGALILLDGLDECGDAKRRAQVAAAVRDLIDHAGPACRFLLTARPYAWPSGPDPALGVYELADLDEEQIEQFIRAWYAAVVKHRWRMPGDAAAEHKIEDLLRAQRRADLRPLACNPLLLTLMATLHTSRGRLPDDRVDLYTESVELLLLRWNQQVDADRALVDELKTPDFKLSALREVLQEVAFKVHEQNVGHQGTADIGEDQLVRALRPLLSNSKDKADILVEYIEKRAGLLIGQGPRESGGERQFAFPHRTFQEYLAACRLAARQDFAAECARLARTAPAHWQEVLPLAARVAGTERGAGAADALIGTSIDKCRTRRTPDPNDWTRAVLAGTQLLEIGLGSIRTHEYTQEIAARVADWLVAALPVHPDQGGLPAAQRAQAGDVLAALGDPRFDPERFYLPADEMLGFIYLEADPEFRIGTRRQDVERTAAVIGAEVPQYEINDALTPVPELYIAKYPVTVAQFGAFVDATQFGIGDPDALRDPPTRPVRWVNWHEALAYCDWLNEQLAGSPQFAGHPLAPLVREQGWRVSLPSELEWEAAARGGLRDQV